MTDYYSTYDLKHVINASGKMTILGVSKVPEAAIQAQQFGDTHFFEMKDLVDKTGAYIAKKLGTEGAVVVNSASAGIAESPRSSVDSRCCGGRGFAQVCRNGR